MKHQDESLSFLLFKRSHDRVNESKKNDVRLLVNDSLDIAARPDDAEAEAEDWDKWLVSSFVCPYGKAPLVCRGDYDAKRHGPLFEGMQKCCSFIAIEGMS